MIPVRKTSVFLYSIFAVVNLCLSREYDANDFSYDETSKNGPSNWGNINVDWVMCKDGVRQSPININNENLDIILTRGNLSIKSYASEAILKNGGHDIQVRWPNGGGLVTIGPKTFAIQQVHWHFPSEHTFYGIRFPLEMHMVLQSSDNETAVIGIVYKLGLPDPFLSKVMTNIEQVITPGSEINLGKFSPPTINLNTAYYRYSGSLTTPPCSEGVTWILPKEQNWTVSRRQLGLLQSAVQFKSNARPIQALNGRRVYLYMQLCSFYK